MADGKSRRAMRRERRDALREVAGKRKLNGGDNINTSKVVEVYTENGHAKTQSEIGADEVNAIYFKNSFKYMYLQT